MEIEINYKNLLGANMFKIDLIVWKLVEVCQNCSRVYEFKIDLIVWKYNIKALYNNFNEKFKIDLIVWK